jgi:hypothetical protein
MPAPVKQHTIKELEASVGREGHARLSSMSQHEKFGRDPAPNGKN